jgi:glycosyltransferase involved in cell wall biosynthesis
LIVDAPNMERQAIIRELRAGAAGVYRPREAVRLFRLASDVRARLRAERAAWNKSSAITVCSGDDLRFVPQGERGKCVVVPNGVHVSMTADRAVGSAAMLFVGSLHYRPNADAAIWLARRLLPAIRREVPAANLRIVGAIAPSVADLGSIPGVSLSGFVDDLLAEYGKSEIAFAPLRSGAGTKLKVLQAFASGIPLVSTPIGIEGIAARSGTHCLIGETEEELVAAAVRLFREPTLGDRLAANARELVESSYSWSASQAVLRRVAEGLTVARGRP